MTNDKSFKRGDMPLSSFDPRYRELILQGCLNIVELKQKTRSDAARMRNILTTFRSRVKTANLHSPEVWEPLYGAIIGVSSDGYSTIIRPRSLEAEHLMQNIVVHRVSDPAEIYDSEGKQIASPNPTLDSDPLAEFTPQSTEEPK